MYVDAREKRHTFTGKWNFGGGGCSCCHCHGGFRPVVGSATQDTRRHGSVGVTPVLLSVTVSPADAVSPARIIVLVLLRMLTLVTQGINFILVFSNSQRNYAV